MGSLWWWWCTARAVLAWRRAVPPRQLSLFTCCYNYLIGFLDTGENTAHQNRRSDYSPCIIRVDMDLSYECVCVCVCVCVCIRCSTVEGWLVYVWRAVLPVDSWRLRRIAAAAAAVAADSSLTCLSLPDVEAFCVQLQHQPSRAAECKLRIVSRRSYARENVPRALL